MTGTAPEPPGSISVGDIDVAGHKAGSEPHRSGGFHHEKRKISTSALPRFQSLDWGLGPRCDSADVREAVSYGFIERHQKAACRLLPPKFHKHEKPSLQAVIRIIALSSDAGVEIRKLVCIVVERMQLRIL